jgi:hypothetical protein
MVPVPDADSACKDEIAREYDTDRAWFDRHPNRTCRVRRALPHEPKGNVPGWRAYAVVWRPVRGAHIKVMLDAHRTWQPPVTERGCMRLLERFASERQGLSTPVYVREAA